GDGDDDRRSPSDRLSGNRERQIICDAVSKFVERIERTRGYQKRPTRWYGEDGRVEIALDNQVARHQRQLAWTDDPARIWRQDGQQVGYLRRYFGDQGGDATGRAGAR